MERNTNYEGAVDSTVVTPTRSQTPQRPGLTGDSEGASGLASYMGSSAANAINAGANEEGAQGKKKRIWKRTPATGS